MKRMLINATQIEELRMAMVDGQRLFDLNIELPASERKKANIYKGKITRIEPSLEAAFVDFGADRHGFLPLKEISSEYFVKQPESGGKPNIKDVLKEGQDIVVQIDKEERGNKGAALTTFVSLAGRFIVLKPNKSRSGGVSRRISGSERDLARESLSSIEIPDGMSVILRTAGIDRSPEELAWDLENLLTIWHAILNVVLERPSPFLIYRESNSVVRALRDYLTTDIGEILIDDEQTFKEASEFVEQVMPHNLKKLKHYTDSVPLFTRFQIESQIESAFTHSVNLPSGGSVVIDHTEALVSIDINSARATKGGDIEATALNTNLEAADEIARQLRIRDLGGLIVIDFIDMGPPKHQRDVENRLRDAVRQDRARVQIGKISRFGLLEMSRQRLRPSLGESSYLTCPRCSGIGTIRSIESLALAILRIIGEEARKERTAKVIAQLPVEVATYLLNEKRDWVRNLESHNEIQMVLVANPALETPHYEVRRVRDDQTDLPENTGASYSLAEPAAEPEAPQAILERKAVEPAAIAVLKPSKPAPKRKASRRGLLSRVLGIFSSEEKPASGKKQQPRRTKSEAGTGRRKGQQQASRKQRDSQGSESQRKRKKKSAGNATKDAAQKNTEKAAKKKDRATPVSKESGEDARKSDRQPSRSRRSRGGRRRKRGTERKDDAVSANSSADSATNGTARPDPNGEPVRKDRPSAAPDSIEKTTAPQEQKPVDASAPPPKPAITEKSPPPVVETQSPASSGSPVPRPAESDGPKVTSGNGAPVQEAAPKPAPAAEPPARPEGRLLPWEPLEPPSSRKDDSKPEASDS